jgi:hypothetical protein
VRRHEEPDVAVGAQCTQPFECPFQQYCRRHEPQAEQPLSWLPGVRTGELKSYIAAHPGGELRDVPDELLNDPQKRIKDVTLSGKPFFDAEGAARALQAHQPPAYFMDFETIQFAVPIWKGTRPYQQIPFQFSVHHIDATGALSHEQFLDLSGDDPSEAFAQALIRACGDAGPVFVYNAAFERSRLRELAGRFVTLAPGLTAICDRIVDLLPIAREYYYHPSQHGSWSIKQVLPTACPDLSYHALDGVQDGTMAGAAFVEALAPQTAAQRKAQIRQQLEAYCGLDTLAMVRLWELFSARTARTPR